MSDIKEKQSIDVQVIDKPKELEEKEYKTEEYTDEEFDHLKFMFTLKRIIDFTDNHCKCQDPFGDRLCNFCYFLKHHDRKHMTTHGMEYDSMVKEFLKHIADIK